MSTILTWLRRDGSPTSAVTRHRLAASLRRTVSKSSPASLPGASPLNRVLVRGHAPELLALADRLDDLSRPVSSEGVFLVEELVSEPWSPLYDSERADLLWPTLSSIRARLDS
jgi:hypothetical protein